MGVSTSPAQLAAKMQAAAASIAGASAEATKAATAFAAQVIRAGAPAKLRNVGKNGAKLGLYSKSGIWSTGVATGVVRAQGPWQIIEFDTKPHPIPKARRRRGSGPVRLPSGEVFASVKHPGTKGKHPFGKGVVKAKAGIPSIYRRAQTLAYTRVFK